MEGYLALNMSVGELVVRHVGWYVGKSVSHKTAIYNSRTRFKPIGFKLRTLITMRRLSISFGRLVAHVKAILDFVVDGKGEGEWLVLRKTSIPLIVSPWLYISCKYNYGFILWHGLEFGTRHFSHTEDRTGCTEFHSRGF